jgi:hypothetical protein
MKAPNLWRWTRPAVYAGLLERTTEDPSALKDGKHKGGRGKRKKGKQKTSRSKYGAYFEEIEQELNDRIEADVMLRVRVTTAWVMRWMRKLVEDARLKEALDGVIDPRKANWKNSGGWFTRFMRRWGWAHRRATNKRAHSAEDLIGDVLGFIMCLREIRRSNPSACARWGVFGPQNTFNQDTVPVSFCSNNNTTIAKRGSVRVSVQKHGTGLDKRQSSLHLLIRALKQQPWPTLILKGATTKDGKRDTKARAAEVTKYKQYRVHVVWQKKAWFDGFVAARDIVPRFEDDFRRLGLADQPKLLMSDNLKAQRSEGFNRWLYRLLVTSVFGPRNGTDLWQPVDHGIGRRYQVIRCCYGDWVIG